MNDVLTQRRSDFARRSAACLLAVSLSACIVIVERPVPREVVVAPPRLADPMPPQPTERIALPPELEAPLMPEPLAVEIEPAPAAVPKVDEALPPAPPLPLQVAEPAKVAAPASAPAKAASSPQVATAPPSVAAVAAPVARAAQPALDVAALKTRLRETAGIGVFEKLSLKNQLDKLLDQFRAQHQSGQTIGLAQLRKPYDQLVQKVLASLQAGDPGLARTILDSREAIWAILVDPLKFNSVN
jgi:hypothetical protein